MKVFLPRLPGRPKRLDCESSHGRSDLSSIRVGGNRGIADKIGTIAQPRVFGVARTVEIERMAALERREAGDFPSAKDARRDAIREVHVTRPERHLQM